MSSQVDLPLGRRIVDAVAMFVVAAISLVLLIYIAFGEARRTYEQFQIEKLVAQGQVVQSAIESFVRPGLPIHQFVGFTQLAEPMVKADPLIDAIIFRDMNDEVVFASGDAKFRDLASPTETRKHDDGEADIRYSGDVVQVILPVRNRFEQVGYVMLAVPRELIAQQVESAFKPLIKIGLAAAICFSLFVLLFAQRFAPETRGKWIGGAFATSFIGVAVVVVSVLISVYAQGAQARAKSLADSLGQRLDDLVAYNINLDDVTGIIQLFGDYKRLNPDIRAAALVVDGKVRAHVDPNRRAVEWDHNPDDYEYTVSISQPNNPRDVQVKVALPRDIVLRQVMRSVKNFAALFIASTFFAALFMGLARSLQRLAQSNKEGYWSTLEETATINLVKPVFFLAVFVEHLSYAFLPTLMQSAAKAANMQAGFASAPFVAYYLMFALSLVPAGRLERRVGGKNLILIGLALAATGLGLIAVNADFWSAMLARGLAGIGQGVLFIGVQAYVLANSSPERRTQANGAIVFGFQAGMIAGMAIGSLLVSYLGPEGIFTLGSTIAAATALYGWMALPSRLSGTEFSDTMHSAWRDMWMMLRNGVFARSVLLVGVPAKAVLTGVVLFALPLLLAQQGFAKEDIGQITMLYAGAVIVASHFAAIKADKTSDTERILFYGATMTAGGLGLIAAASLVNWGLHATSGTLVILAGVTLVGFAHGCINAPVVTHITQTQVASTYGVTNAAAAYRLMERVGHVLGPMIMGQLFVYLGTSWTVFGWIALVIFIMGVLFLSPANQADSSAPSPRM